MTDPTIALLLGPIGLTIFLLYVVKLLWDAHRQEDASRTARLDTAIAGWAAQTAATEKLAAAVDRSNKRRTMPQ